MLATLLAFLGTATGKSILVGIGVWALGMSRKTGPYRAVRSAYGKALFSAGALLSRAGTGWLGQVAWAPFEGIIDDLIGLGAEQASAGLRADNVEKLEERLGILKDVGSQARAQAVAAKLAALSDALAPVNGPRDAEIMARAADAANESLREKLGQ